MLLWPYIRVRVGVVVEQYNSPDFARFVSHGRVELPVDTIGLSKTVVGVSRYSVWCVGCCCER